MNVRILNPAKQSRVWKNWESVLALSCLPDYYSANTMVRLMHLAISSFKVLWHEELSPLHRIVLPQLTGSLYKCYRLRGVLCFDTLIDPQPSQLFAYVLRFPPHWIHLRPQ